MSRKHRKSRATVVLGGSFNPPTKAHAALMSASMERAAKAYGTPVEGIYVPSSDAYVSRKIGKLPKGARLKYSEDARSDMLLAMAGEVCSVSPVEYGDDGKGRSYETMLTVRETDPGSRHIFVVGADKLRILPRWRNIEKFLSDFVIGVVTRDNKSVLDAIRSDPVLSRYEKSFLFIPDLPEEYAGISSTKARAAAMAGDWETVRSLCGDAVADIMMREAAPETASA